MVNVSLEELGDVARRYLPSGEHRTARGRQTRVSCRNQRVQGRPGTVVSVGRSIMRSCRLLLDLDETVQRVGARWDLNS